MDRIDAEAVDSDLSPETQDFLTHIADEDLLRFLRIVGGNADKPVTTGELGVIGGAILGHGSGGVVLSRAA